MLLNINFTAVLILKHKNEEYTIVAAFLGINLIAVSEMQVGELRETAIWGDCFQLGVQALR